MPLSVKCGVITRTITHIERVSLHPEWLRERPQDYHYNTRGAFMTGNVIPAQVYYKAQKLRALVRREVLEALQHVDVLVQPTSPGPAELINLQARVQGKDQPNGPWRREVSGAGAALPALRGCPSCAGSPRKATGPSLWPCRSLAGPSTKPR